MFNKINAKELKELETELDKAWQELFYNKPMNNRIGVLDLAMARSLITSVKRHRQLKPKLKELLNALDEETRRKLKH